MKAPVGTTEYEEKIRNAREYLARLKKGRALLQEATKDSNIAEATKIVKHYNTVSEECFQELEMATLLLQFQTSHSSVWVRADGSLVKAEEVVDGNAVEIDPWMLYSANMLMNVFGPEIKEYLEFKE